MSYDQFKGEPTLEQQAQDFQRELRSSNLFHYTTTSSSVCAHLNGWHVVVPFWIFTKRVFVCSDCGEVRDSPSGRDRNVD